MFDPADTKDIMKTAMADYQEQMLFRRYVQSAVASAMDELKGRFHEDTRLQDVHDAATLAAMTVLRMAIVGDDMLRMVQVERDHYKKIAEESLSLRPLQFVVPNDALRS